MTLLVRLSKCSMYVYAIAKLGCPKHCASETDNSSNIHSGTKACQVHTVSMCPEFPELEGGHATCVAEHDHNNMLNAFIHILNTSVFNKTTIAQGLEHVDIARGLKRSIGIHVAWIMVGSLFNA